MIVAGVGCRRGCPAETIVALVRRAEREAGVQVQLLAVPEFKRDEPGVNGAAAALGLMVRHVDHAALGAAQSDAVTRSAAVLEATGHASIAEAAALAASGGRLLLRRIGEGQATCAIAG